MEHLAKVLEALGIGLSRLLRYSYGGFLLIVLASVVNPIDTEKTLKPMPWELAALSAVVLGAGIYAAHRSLVVPLTSSACAFSSGSGNVAGKSQESSQSAPHAGLGLLECHGFSGCGPIIPCDEATSSRKRKDRG